MFKNSQTQPNLILKIKFQPNLPNHENQPIKGIELGLVGSSSGWRVG